MISVPRAWEAFPDHPVVHSRDLDCAQAGLTNFFLPVELSVRHVPTALDIRLNVVTVGRATVGFLRFGDAVSISTAEAADYHIDIPLSGTMVARAGAGTPLYSDPRTAAVFMPELPAQLDCDSDLAQLCVMLPRMEVHSELENMLGKSITKSPIFSNSLDLTEPGGVTLKQVLGLVDSESRRPSGLLSHPLAAQRVEQVLMDALILAESHNYSEAIRARQPAAGVRPVARAVELLRGRPEYPWTAGELAAATSMSTRSLHDGFRRSMGTTPMAYLREIRLNAVREELALAKPDGVAVGEAAAKWGFVHLGRFAAAYRKQFGELPSATLRSTRPSGTRQI